MSAGGAAVVERFRVGLEYSAGRLHEAGSLRDARALTRELVAGAGVARWDDAILEDIVASSVPAVEAEVSLIVADVGVAASGAIGFVHGPGRSRATGVLPARQIALLAAGDLVADLTAAVLRLMGPDGVPPANVVFAGGPSRTADIEQRAIQGVHAPRELDVVLFS